MTTITGNQIAVDQLSSVSAGNLLRYNADGLFVALAAVANIAEQFVSSSTGNDSNDGSRGAPLKTLAFALSRIPSNTSGTIYLYETDTFPVRATTDPTTWGSVIDYYGSALNTTYRNVEIGPYGPQTDNYNALAKGALNFTGWIISESPRPILEFGHYMYNGKPVGCAFVLGAASGQLAIIRGCELRVTQEARAAANAANAIWSAQGNKQFILGVNAVIAGCILPSPLVVPSGAKTWTSSMHENVSFIHCYMPAETTPWLVCSGTSNLNFASIGGTVNDKNGKSYTTLPNTVTTNIATRVEGVVKDSKGITRNVFSNLNI